MEILAVDPKKVPDFWEVIRDLLQEAADRSAHYTIADIYKALIEEQGYLWLIHDGKKLRAALVTRLEITKDGKTGCVWAMGGVGMKEWAHLIAPIEAWARTEGCTRMRHMGRPGLAKIMRKFGYRMTHATIEKAI